jgi:hypothetical protein
VVSVEAAVEREVKGLGKFRDSALAATALALAAEIDDPDNSATSKSMCAKALNETMAALHALAPAKREPDGIDEVTSRRVQRRRSSRASGA